MAKGLHMETINRNVDILHIEDDEVDILCVEREFKRVNNLLNIAVARDGVQAFDKLYGLNGEEKLTPPPKLIILDINMPRMNGIEFLKKLRSDPDLSYVSTYILTVAYTTEDKLAIRDLKVAGCIVKPLDYAEALDIFWSLLNEKDL